MTQSFYQMALGLIGEVPDTLTWLYDLTTVCLVLSAFALLIIPVSIIFKRVVGR